MARHHDESIHFHLVDNTARTRRTHFRNHSLDRIAVDYHGPFVVASSDALASSCVGSWVLAAAIVCPSVVVSVVFAEQLVETWPPDLYVLSCYWVACRCHMGGLVAVEVRRTSLAALVRAHCIHWNWDWLSI